MTSKRHQDLWIHRPNNSILFLEPTPTQVSNIYSFCEHFNDHLPHFVFTCVNILKNIKIQEPPLLVDSQDTLTMLIEILKEQKFIFIDALSQIRNSYKGYVSWILLGTQSRLYVIDSARLHDLCFRLKEALERKDLIKFTHECQEAIFGMKRDWQIFMPNVFDLEVVQRYLAKQGKSSIQSRNILREYLGSVPSPINLRPIKSGSLIKFQDYYECEVQLLLSLDKFFTTSDPSYHCYAYFNHYDFLLKPYCHVSLSVKERDETERAKRGLNSFAKYSSHQEMAQEVVVNKENELWQKDFEEQMMATMFCEWREHVAKMRDLNVEEVLAYETVSKLSKTKLNSILQVSELCEPSHNANPTIYSLSLEDFEQIFELFQLQKQQAQERAHQLTIPRRLPYFKSTDQKPIKELFSQINFRDPSNQWLNKKTDESVRLYKEIVSISEFDNSVVEEYFREVERGLGGWSVEQEVSRYVKYGECFRAKNHKKLQELYDRSKTQKQTGTNGLDYFDEDFLAKDQEQDNNNNWEGVKNWEEANNWDEVKNWEEIEEELNFPTMDTINHHPKSIQSFTSLKSITNLGIHSCKNFSSNQSKTVLKEKQVNSLKLLESPSSIFTKIEPLPESIEAIYVEAARAKKSYGVKGQKKGGKIGKKEGVNNKGRENNKKEEEFLPKKQEIFNLIYY